MGGVIPVKVNYAGYFPSVRGKEAGTPVVPPSGDATAEDTAEVRQVVVPVAPAVAAAETAPDAQQIQRVLALLENAQQRLHQEIERVLSEDREHARQTELQTLQHRLEALRQRIAQLRAYLGSVPPARQRAAASLLAHAQQTLEALVAQLGTGEISEEAITAALTNLEQVTERLEGIRSLEDGLTAEQRTALDTLLDRRITVDDDFLSALRAHGLLARMTGDELVRVCEARWFFALYVQDGNALRQGISERTDRLFVTILEATRFGLTQSVLNRMLREAGISDVRFSREAMRQIFGGGDDRVAESITEFTSGLRRLFDTAQMTLDGMRPELTLGDIIADEESLPGTAQELHRFFRQYAAENSFLLMDQSTLRNAGIQVALRLGINVSAAEVTAEAQRRQEAGEEALSPELLRAELLLQRFLEYLAQRGGVYQRIVNGVSSMREGYTLGEQWSALMLRLYAEQRQRTHAEARRGDDDPSVEAERAQRDRDEFIRRLGEVESAGRGYRLPQREWVLYEVPELREGAFGAWVEQVHRMVDGDPALPRAGAQLVPEHVPISEVR